MIDTLGTIRLESDDPRLTVTIIMTKAPILVAGSGGWQKVARPRRTALTEWVGRDPLAYRVEFIIDELTSDDGVAGEQACQALERLSGVTNEDEEPPVLTIQSSPTNLIMFGYNRYPAKRWIIEAGPEWDADSIVTNMGGHRLRAMGSLTLSEFIEDERLEELSAIQRRKRRKRKSKGKGKRGAKRKTHTVRRGETLSSIAARELGSSSRWQEIGKLNGIRDPKAITVGQELKLP